MLEYKGFKIAGSSIPMYMSGCESLGTVYRPGSNGSIIEAARIEGKIFDTMKQAEAHGWSWRGSGWITLRNSLSLLSRGSRGGFLFGGYAFHAASQGFHDVDNLGATLRRWR